MCVKIVVSQKKYPIMNYLKINFFLAKIIKVINKSILFQNIINNTNIGIL